jgi:hypothetical protein
MLNEFASMLELGEKRIDMIVATAGGEAISLEGPQYMKKLMGSIYSVCISSNIVCVLQGDECQVLDGKNGEEMIVDGSRWISSVRIVDDSLYVCVKGGPSDLMGPARPAANRVANRAANRAAPAAKRPAANRSGGKRPKKRPKVVYDDDDDDDESGVKQNVIDLSSDDEEEKNVPIDPIGMIEGLEFYPTRSYHHAFSQSGTKHLCLPTDAFGVGTTKYHRAMTTEVVEMDAQYNFAMSILLENGREFAFVPIGMQVKLTYGLMAKMKNDDGGYEFVHVLGDTINAKPFGIHSRLLIPVESYVKKMKKEKNEARISIPLFLWKMCEIFQDRKSNWEECDESWYEEGSDDKKLPTAEGLEQLTIHFKNEWGSQKLW